MKQYWSLGFFIIIGCTQESGPHSLRIGDIRYRIVQQDLSLGEYAKLENKDTVITVSRTPPTVGLVKVDLSTSAVEVLNAEAGNARDIFALGSLILFRLENKIVFQNESSNKVLIHDASKLLGLWKNSDHYEFAYEDKSNVSKHILFSKEGIIQNTPHFPASFRAQAEGRWFLFQKADGLWLYERSGIWIPRVLFGPKLFSSYVRFVVRDKKFRIAFLDEESGILRFSEISQDFSSATLEVIDGEENNHYRGMDIASFQDGDELGYIYLDAWALNLRMARKIDGHWKSTSLPFKGAVGFYNQTASLSDRELRIVFHNFRSEHDDLTHSFEDLAVAEITLNP